MLKFYVLLISSLIVTPILGQTLVSGSVTTTMYSNTDYAQPIIEGTVRASTDLTKSLLIKGSLTTIGAPIQTLGLEWHPSTSANWQTGDYEYSFFVGRYPRISALYNDISDNPGTYGTAQLPPGTYPTRLVRAKITLADGVQMSARKNLASGLLILKAAVGTGVDSVPSQVNKEFLGATSTYTASPTTNGAKDLSISYERGPYKVYISRSEFPYQFTDPNTLRSEQYVNRVGGSYEIGDVTIESELMQITSLYMLVDNTIYDVSYTGASLTAKYQINNDFTAYVSASNGKYADNSNFMTHSIGLTHDRDSLTTSIEYMAGSGTALPSAESTKKQWSSIILSITKRF